MHKDQVLAQLVEDDYRAAVAQAQASIASATAQAEALKAQQQLQLATIEAARAVVAVHRARRSSRTTATSRASTGFCRPAPPRPRPARSSRPHTRSSPRSSLKTGPRRARRRAPAGRARRRSCSRAEAADRRGASRPRDGQAQSGLHHHHRDAGRGPRAAPGEAGQLVGAGSQITTLTPLPNVWVIANYKETQLTHMAVGQKAEITVDTFPGHTLRGHVRAFSPASGAEFALLPPGQCHRKLHQGRAAHRGEDRDRRCGRPRRSTRARHVGRGEDRRPGRQALMSAVAPIARSGVTAPTLPTPPTSIPWLGLARGAHGHVHIDLERPPVDVRSRRHTRCTRRGLRRRRVDHHGADRRADVRHDRRDLDGRRLRSAPGADRRVHRVCAHFPVDAVFRDPADAS